MSPGEIEPMLLAAIHDRSRVGRLSVVTRLDVARLYASGIEVYPDGPNWGTVNAAILQCWSPSGLNWIKREAWKLARHIAAPVKAERPED